MYGADAFVSGSLIVQPRDRRMKTATSRSGTFGSRTAYDANLICFHERASTHVDALSRIVSSDKANALRGCAPNDALLVLTIHDERVDRWWARRKCAFGCLDAREQVTQPVRRGDAQSAGLKGAAAAGGITIAYGDARRALVDHCASAWFGVIMYS